MKGHALENRKQFLKEDDSLQMWPSAPGSLKKLKIFEKKLKKIGYFTSIPEKGAFW